MAIVRKRSNTAGFTLEYNKLYHFILKIQINKYIYILYKRISIYIYIYLIQKNI